MTTGIHIYESEDRNRSAYRKYLELEIMISEWVYIACKVR